jgi:hypothetical protein
MVRQWKAVLLESEMMLDELDIELMLDSRCTMLVFGVGDWLRSQRFGVSLYPSRPRIPRISHFCYQVKVVFFISSSFYFHHESRSGSKLGPKLS